MSAAISASSSTIRTTGTWSSIAAPSLLSVPVPHNPVGACPTRFCAQNYPRTLWRGGSSAEIEVDGLACVRRRIFDSVRHARRLPSFGSVHPSLVPYFRAPGASDDRGHGHRAPPAHLDRLPMAVLGDPVAWPPHVGYQRRGLV